MPLRIPYNSHQDPTHKGGTAPARAHMAYHLHGQTAEDLTALPEGTHLFFIKRPDWADTIIEVILQKVVYKDRRFMGLECVAYSTSWKTTRRLTLTAAWDGHYLSGLDKGAEAAMDVIEGKDKKL